MFEKINSFATEHIYILVVVSVLLIFALIIGFFRKKQHFTTSRILYISVTILSVLFGTFSSDITTVFAMSIVFICTNVILDAVVKLEDILEDLKKEKTEIQNHISHNPVFKSKNSHKELVDNLPKICAKDSVLEFFEKTFTQVETKGLINIDTTLVAYTNRLKGIAESTKQSIIGTYTTRPITTYTDREDNSFKSYNSILSVIANRKKNKVEVIRIVVLSDTDISDIIEANKNPQCEVGGTKITEIDWFTQHWSKNITVLWTSENIINEFFNNAMNNFKELIHLYNGTNISDFAVFDKKLYVTWRKYDTTTMNNLEHIYGNMILNWNNVIPSLCETFDKTKLIEQQGAFGTFEKLQSSISNGKNRKK
jgi:hypothetical protein